jgi:SAM-dependent methyltransferase
MEQMLTATAASEDAHAWFRGLRRVARQMLDEAARDQRLDRIVDCGSGTGRNLDWLADLGRPVGVELTPVGLQAGRKKGRPLIRGSVAALPFADTTFDLATSFDVLYCLDDATEAQALLEMWRVLRPGGIVLVNAAAFEVLRGSHSTLTHEVRRYTPRSLTQRLTTAGFTVERVTCTNALLFLPTLAVRGFQQLTGRAAEPSDADLAVPSAPVNAVLNWELTLEARLLKLMNFPFGTSVMAVGRKPETSVTPQST